MLSNLILIPNQITAFRFLLVPVLWIMALAGLPGYIGIGLILCFISDTLDGQVARRLNQKTDFGSKFDSLADNLLILSSLIWLLMLKPQVFIEHPWPSLLATGTYISSLVVGLVKFRRFANLHLHLSKLAGLMEYIFIIHIFTASTYSLWLFYLTIVIFTLSSLETLLLQLVNREVNTHMGSLILVYIRRHPPAVLPSRPAGLLYQWLNTRAYLSNKTAVPKGTLFANLINLFLRICRAVYGPSPA